MLLRVLGPVEVRTGQGWRGIGAPKWRALLAALLLGRGTVVSVDGLINELWPSGPPVAARKLISGYAARVRSLIGDGDGPLLVTRPPGYALLVDRSDVDAWVFGSGCQQDWWATEFTPGNISSIFYNNRHILGSTRYHYATTAAINNILN